MDFLDQPAASVNRAVYNEFLGLGNNKQKATAQNSHEQDLLNRFPFSLDCNEQKKLVQTMLAESLATGAERNSARRNSKHRNNLTGKIRAFDAYIPQAIDFMNNVACSVSANPPAEPAKTTTAPADPVIGTIPVTANAVAAAGSLPAGLSGDKMIKYSLIGLGALIVVVVIIAVVKRRP